MNARTSKMGIWAAMAVSALLSAIFIAQASFSVNGLRAFTLFDDAMISTRYARNFADGNGLVWNAGERIEGYTNFLWTLWMSLLHLLPLPDRLQPLLVSITGAVLLMLAVWLASHLARELRPESQFAPVAAAFLTALCYPLAFWTLRGMEVGLIAVVTTAVTLLCLQMVREPSMKKAFAIGALLAVGLLTRPDAAVIAAVAIGFLVVGLHDSPNRKYLLPVVAVPALAFAAHLGFRFAYYGELVPNTYTLKIEGFPLRNRLVRGAKSVWQLLFQGGFAVAVAMALLAIWNAKRCASLRRYLLPAAMVGIFVAYSIYVGGDAWESIYIANRYITSMLPVFLVLVALGVDAVSQYSRVVAGALSVATIATIGLATIEIPPLDYFYPQAVELNGTLVAGAAIVLLGLLLGVFRKQLAPAYLIIGVLFTTFAGNWIFTLGNHASEVNGDNLWAQYGMALSEMTEPGARLAISSAGNIPY